MLRIILRVFTVLFLMSGLVCTAVAAYLLFTPSDEETLYEQKYKEMTEKYEKARVAKDPVEKARLRKESEDAAGSAKSWGEGARVRRLSYQLALGVSLPISFFGFVGLVLTFVGRKPSTAG
jgi:cytochrome c-type biogenesis protein CcmH/NrfG